MSEILNQLIRSTKEYSDVCDTCKNEILIYPTISGKTEYSQDEVEQITLKRIINKLQAKEQECEELKSENFTFEELIKTQENELEKLKDRNQYVEGNIEIFENERNELEQKCEKLKQWKEDAENLFKTQTDNANKIINRYKQALDEIESLAKNDINFKYNDKRFTITQILNIIDKAKEQ